MNHEPNVEQGLCGRCVHRQLVRSRRSVFLRCSLADQDPRFPRYPTLPVLACAGFTAAPAAATEPPSLTSKAGAAPAPASAED